MDTSLSSKSSVWQIKNFCGALGVLRGFGGIFVFWVCVGFWKICHFEPFAKRRKIHIVILSVSEISTEFKIRLKALKSHFDFMDTSLSYESSVWQFHWYDKIYAFVWILNDSTAFFADCHTRLTPYFDIKFSPQNSVQRLL